MGVLKKIHLQAPWKDKCFLNLDTNMTSHVVVMWRNLICYSKHASGSEACRRLTQPNNSVTPDVWCNVKKKKKKKTWGECVWRISASCVSGLNTSPGVQQPHRGPVISIHWATPTIYDYHRHSKCNVTLFMFSHAHWAVAQLKYLLVKWPDQQYIFHQC